MMQARLSTHRRREQLQSDHGVGLKTVPAQRKRATRMTLVARMDSDTSCTATVETQRVRREPSHAERALVDGPGLRKDFETSVG